MNVYCGLVEYLNPDSLRAEYNPIKTLKLNRNPSERESGLRYSTNCRYAWCVGEYMFWFQSRSSYQDTERDEVAGERRENLGLNCN